MKILWINQRDSDDNYELIQQMSLNYDIDEIINDENLVSTIKANPQVIVVFDFDYPDPVRLSEMKEIKRQVPNVPIIMLTVYHSEELAVWAFRSRVWDYLVKPVDVEQFDKTIKLLLKIKEDLPSDLRPCLMREQPLPADLAKGHARVNRTSPAVSYIRSNYSQKITLEYVSKLCSMGVFQFSRIFKKEQGLTFQQYVMQYRIKKAIEKINSKGDHITDVAFDVGFNDLSYFARVFKRHVGICPSEYRSKVVPSTYKSKVMPALK